MLVLLILLYLLVSPSYYNRHRLYGYRRMHWGIPFGMWSIYRMPHRPYGMHRGFRGPRF